MKLNKILRIGSIVLAGIISALCIVFIILAAVAPSGSDDAKATILDIPSGLVYDAEDAAFEWNAVKGADGYVLKLNGTEKRTAENRYALGADEFGSFTAQVKAKGKGNTADSSYSASVTGTRVRPILPLQKPTGLSYGGGLLSWNAVDGAVSYVVTVGEMQFTTTEAYYLLPATVSGESVAKVQAVGDGVLFSNSPYSDAFLFMVTDPTVKTLEKPAFFRFDKENKLLKWSKPSGATGYVLTVNGGEPIVLNAYATQYAWSDSTEFTAAIYATDGETVGEVAEISVSDTVQEISTETQLLDIQPNGSYKLTADIALSKPWMPVDFYGSFDGNGKTVSGLHIRTAAEYAGFFGAVIDAEIKGLTLVGATIEAERQSGLGQLGVLCGRLENSTVENCKVSATVTAIYYTAGGFIGSVAEGNATVVGCFADVVMAVTGGGYAGGFIGEINTNGACVEKCGVTGSIEAEFSVGGFVGYVGYGKIKNCYTATALSLHKDGNAVGGFIATLQGRNVSVTACYSACTVSYKGDGAAAGFAAIAPGGSYGGDIFSACYYDSILYKLNGNSVGNSGSANGITATATMKDGETLNGFDGEVWLFEDGKYPILK